MNPTVILGGGASLVVILGGIVVWLKWARRPWRTIRRFFARLDETINGKDAETDAWGREVHPAIPPLAEQMTGIRATVDALVERDERLSAIEQTVAEHGHRLTAIEAGHQIERTMGHVAQAKVMDAIGEVAKKHDHDPDA